MPKWIEFREAPSAAGRKTKTWIVAAKDGARLGGRLGLIEWYSPWRCYCFAPDAATVYERTCLRDIASFCEAKTKEHYWALKQQRNSAA